MVNFTIYLRGGFRKLPRLQFWLLRASWSLQVCLNCSWEVFDAAHMVIDTYALTSLQTSLGQEGFQAALSSTYRRTA